MASLASSLARGAARGRRQQLPRLLRRALQLLHPCLDHAHAELVRLFVETFVPRQNPAGFFASLLLRRRGLLPRVALGLLRRQLIVKHPLHRPSTALLGYPPALRQLRLQPAAPPVAVVEQVQTRQRLFLAEIFDEPVVQTPAPRGDPIRVRLDEPRRLLREHLRGNRCRLGVHVVRTLGAEQRVHLLHQPVHVTRLLPTERRRRRTRLVFVVAVVVIDAVDVVALDPVLVPGHARDAFLSLFVIFPEIRLFISGLSPANL